ncbi:hypothetical protein [Pseudomonas fluorescens]|nr:hypothetical protein [Pseudomonas fluorescens]
MLAAGNGDGTSRYRVAESAIKNRSPLNFIIAVDSKNTIAKELKLGLDV